MKPYEMEVLKDFEEFANVAEAWCIYDTIVIDSAMYGNESNIKGWYNTLSAFGTDQEHRFFKERTEGSAGLAYCNQQSADQMDFAFKCHSIGIHVSAPAPNVEGVLNQADGTVGAVRYPDALVGHWFAADLPRHAAIQFKVHQDIIAEMPLIQCAPGYGATGSGTAFQRGDTLGGTVYGDIPFMSNAVCQGVPILSNRFPLPEPIGIPRTAPIEGILTLSDYARTTLTNILGPRHYQFNSDTGDVPYTFFPKRYSIQFSLMGERLVQQRGQYHR